MELDEIKAAWNDLNLRLEKSEALNRRMLAGMLENRQQSAKDKLMKYEVFFLVLCIFSGILLIPAWLGGLYSPIVSAVFECVFVVAAIWQVYKIILLRRMSIERCSTTDLIQKAIRFKVVTRMRTVVGLIMLIPIVFIICLFDVKESMPVYIGMCVGGVIGLTIGLVLFFRNLKDIDSLIKSYKDTLDFNED